MARGGLVAQRQSDNLRATVSGSGGLHCSTYRETGIAPFGVPQYLKRVAGDISWEKGNAG
jgi:hypothetical protein